jgi:hypothetical protein
MPLTGHVGCHTKAQCYQRFYSTHAPSRPRVRWVEWRSRLAAEFDEDDAEDDQGEG